MVDSPHHDSADPDAQIMRATYRALQEYGYDDLTVQRIAEEYGKSTAAIHYYYDTKDDLLAAFLDYLLDYFVDTIHEVEITDPEQRLELLLDKLLVDPGDHLDMLIALLEMRSQAPYNDAFAERFHQNDEYARYLLKTVIDHGISEGVFSEVNSEQVSRSLMTITDGGRTRAVVFDETECLETARRTVEEYVNAVLKKDTTVGEDQ